LNAEDLHTAVVVGGLSKQNTKALELLLRAVAYAETFHGGCFIQRHRVVICIWCALFVTSQNDVMVLFANQRFGEVC